MLDLIIRGGSIVDGSGTPAFAGDVGIAGGRIVALGTVDASATEVIDVDGHVVAPGFIDLHTHYDAQAFWDTTLSPSPLHGVTTVFAGNCGFTIAPLAPEDGDYLMRMLARVEGMPLESLQAGVPWDWRSFGDYLDQLDGTLMPNAGFLVGHSALRRHVMHGAATERHATSEELAAMQQLLRAGLASGGMGFSSTWSTSHNDHEGVPVPSRHASREELIALCSVVSEYPGTTLEFIPQVGAMTDASFEMMADMSAAANRPLNWNLLQVSGQNWDHVQHQLRGAEVAEARGGKVFALTLPDSFRMRLNFRSGFVLDILNGWDKLMALPPAEKLRQLRDPEHRAEWDRLAQASAGTLRTLANWAGYYLLETFAPEWKPHQGRLIGEIAGRARPVAVGHAVRCRAGRRAQDRDRQPGSGPGRRLVVPSGRGLAGRPHDHRRVRRRGPPRHDRFLLVLDGRARSRGAGALAAAGRGGRAAADRRAGSALRPEGAGSARPRGTTPTSWSSTPRPSARRPSRPASTCRAGRCACTAEPRASPTCSSTARSACGGPSCSKPDRGPCSVRDATPPPSPPADSGSGRELLVTGRRREGSELHRHIGGDPPGDDVEIVRAVGLGPVADRHVDARRGVAGDRLGVSRRRSGLAGCGDAQPPRRDVRTRSRG